MKTVLVALPEGLIQDLRSALIWAINTSTNGDYRVAYRLAEKRFYEIVEEAKTDQAEPGVIQPNIKISSHNVAVDQNYFWDLSMAQCPQGKVQLLGRGGLPFYGKQSEAPNFAIAWAALPKLPANFNPEILK